MIIEYFTESDSKDCPWCITGAAYVIGLLGHNAVCRCRDCGMECLMNVKGE